MIEYVVHSMGQTKRDRSVSKWKPSKTCGAGSHSEKVAFERSDGREQCPGSVLFIADISKILKLV